MSWVQYGQIHGNQEKKYFFQTFELAIFDKSMIVETFFHLTQKTVQKMFKNVCATSDHRLAIF